MIDSFSMSTVFPKYHPRAGEPTGFEEAIFEHKKLHTIRSGNRWMAGDTARVFVWIGEFNNIEMRLLAENDGLAVQDFLDWFSPYVPFSGQIICLGNVDYCC